MTGWSTGALQNSTAHGSHPRSLVVTAVSMLTRIQAGLASRLVGLVPLSNRLVPYFGGSTMPSGQPSRYGWSSSNAPAGPILTATPARGSSPVPAVGPVLETRLGS